MATLYQKIELLQDMLEAINDFEAHKMAPPPELKASYIRLSREVVDLLKG